MKLGNFLTLIGLGSTLTLNLFADDNTTLLNQERLSVANSTVLIERTEMTPEKVKIEVPIAFPHTYCTGYTTHSRYVPCPDYSGGGSSGGGSSRPPNSGGSSGGHSGGSSSGGSHGGGSSRPPHSGGSSGGHSGGGAHRPPNSGGGRPPHFEAVNKCTETYRTCDGYATTYETEDRTLTLKFKGDAAEYKGTEVYQVVGKALSSVTGSFELIPMNDLAKSHKLNKNGRKHFVVK